MVALLIMLNFNFNLTNLTKLFWLPLGSFVFKINKITETFLKISYVSFTE